MKNEIYLLWNVTFHNRQKTCTLWEVSTNFDYIKMRGGKKHPSGARTQVGVDHCKDKNHFWIEIRKDEGYD